VLASLTGVLVQRTGQRRAHQATVLGVAASLALLAVLTGAAAAVGAHLAPPVTTALVVLAAVTFGVTYNGVVAVQGMWSAAVFAERPSAGLAAVNTSLTVGTLVGPALGGFVIALSGYGPALALAALLTALALPLAPPAPAAARTARSAVETGSVRTNASTG
jgi:MFS family permease